MKYVQETLLMDSENQTPLDYACGEKVKRLLQIIEERTKLLER